MLINTKRLYCVSPDVEFFVAASSLEEALLVAERAWRNDAAKQVAIAAHDIREAIATDEKNTLPWGNDDDKTCGYYLDRTPAFWRLRAKSKCQRAGCKNRATYVVIGEPQVAFCCSDHIRTVTDAVGVLSESPVRSQEIREA